jgi:non-ribosomal peptide synthetase component F
VQPFYQHSATSKLDLTFNFNEDSTGLYLGLEYNSDLFAPARMARLGRLWQELIGSILATPERAVGELAWLPEAERERLLTEFNRSPVYPTEGVVDVWRRVVQERGGDTAVFSPDPTQPNLTFNQLDQRSQHIAHSLRQQYQLAPETRIALLLPRTSDLPLALLAVLKAGAAYLPIDPIYPPNASPPC